MVVCGAQAARTRIVMRARGRTSASVAEDDEESPGTNHVGASRAPAFARWTDPTGEPQSAWLALNLVVPAISLVLPSGPSGSPALSVGSRDSRDSPPPRTRIVGWDLHPANRGREKQ
jgi:hypothetical protein